MIPIGHRDIRFLARLKAASNLRSAWGTTIKKRGVLRLMRGIAVIAWLAAADMASAHSSPEKAIPFHGGIAVTTEAFNLELLVVDGRLRLYVRDRYNRPLDVSACNAEALAWGRENSIKIDLKPHDRNSLEGDLQVVSLRRVIVSLKMPGLQPMKAWFTGGF